MTVKPKVLHYGMWNSGKQRSKRDMIDEASSLPKRNTLGSYPVDCTDLYIYTMMFQPLEAG
jgi:hypothetical protein